MLTFNSNKSRNNRLIMAIKFVFFLTATFFFSSCESLIGEDGVVIDVETGERIANVTVKMQSNDGANREDLTDSIGYFNTVKMTGCGLGNCDENYTITFEKEGYQTRSIDNSYYKDPNSEFVTEGKKDTLIVKMQFN